MMKDKYIGIVIILCSCITWISTQDNKTLELGVIAKPHPKGMYMYMIVQMRLVCSIYRKKPNEICLSDIINM